MRSRIANTAVAVLAVAAATAGVLVGAHGDDGEAATRPAATTYTAHGLTVRLPAGWQAAPHSLTPHLVDPRERLTVGTFPLRYRRMGCAHLPSSALADLGPRDALITIQERGRHAGAGFPPRPARFGPRLGGPSEARGCVPGARFADHWFAFADGGRKFHVLVGFGSRATAATQRAAWRILDGLRVDPRVRPTWSASP